MHSLKILYVITTVGHGKGGHFYSLKEIAQAIQTKSEVYILNIGKNISPVLFDSKLNIHFIEHRNISFFTTVKKVFQYIKALSPDVIHAFDIEALFFSRIASYLTKIPLVLTKCGGPNPVRYFPYVKYLILFSKENYSYFHNNFKFKTSVLALIPNRIVKPEADLNRIKLLKDRYGLNKEIILLRIGRISKHYKKTLEQGINLTKALHNNNISIKFLIIGTIQDNAVLEYLKKRIDSYSLNKHVIIESDTTFTKNSAQLLPIGHLIIGTGRGFMEACAFGKILLIPNNDIDIPLLVTNENFHKVFHYNFSPRTTLQSINYEKNLQQIILSIDNAFKENQQSMQWFHQFFNVYSAIEKYIDFYNKVYYYPERHIFDFSIHFLKTFKAFI